jgi:LysR family hydrogen peroxide-inducible transcriptional activator
LPEGHPLLKQKELSTQDLEREGLLLLSEGHCFRSQMLEVCRNRKAKKDSAHFHFESGSFEALISLVDSGIGYTILPQLAVERLIRDNRKKRLRPFQDPEPVREVSLVRSRQFSKKKIADTLAQQIQSEMAENLKLKPAKRAIVPIS